MSQFSLLIVPISCLSFLVRLIRWTHATSHGSQILRWRSYGWRNLVVYGYVLMLLWILQLLIVVDCFAMWLRGITTTSLSASGNSWNDLLWISLVIHSQQTKGLRKITYLTLMKLIIKALCLPVVSSTIPVLILAIQRSSLYHISLLLLLILLILAIWILWKLKSKEGGIIGSLGVTTIGCYITEIDVWRWVSITAMTVLFGVRWGPTTVNRITVTAFQIHHEPLVTNRWHIFLRHFFSCLMF